MRILHVIPFFAPSWMYGGPVRATWEIARRLAKRGHHVSVFATDAYGGGRFPRPLGQPMDLDGIEVTYFRLAGGAGGPYLSPALGHALSQRVGGFDVAHTSCGFSWTGVQLRKHALLAGVPYVYQAHGAMDRVKWRNKHLRKRLFFLFFEKRVLRDAAALVALTPFEARNYQNLGAAPERIVIIPNGVDTDEYSPSTKRGAFRSGHGIPDEVPLVAYVGRIEHIKGVDRLLEAFHRLLESVPQARLVMAGPDEGMRAPLEARAAALGIGDRVHFIGELDTSQTRALYHDADVFALFSYGEGLPLAALEAMACGLPVVISEESHLPQVEEAGAGVVIKNGDIEAFAAALARFLNDKTACESSSQKAVELVRREFQWESAVDRIESLYRALMRR